MLVSVVIPVYNCAVYVHQTLESVLKQTHENIEILICDDGSTDSTLEIIRTFRDERIAIFESPVNKGQAHQLNKGISLARGEYIAIMHGDDICYPDRIEKQLAYMETNQTVDICGCWIDFAGDWEKYKYQGGVYKYFSDDVLLKLNLVEGVPFAHPSVFLRRSLVETGRFIYKQEYVPAEDWELWVRLAPHVHFGNVEKTLLTYRIHDDQISVTAAEKFENCRKYIRQQYFKLLYHFSERSFIIKKFR
jgi:glycosyltransferase involved in cell wall biosynthesis